jgi:hypothetical protein
VDIKRDVANQGQKREDVGNLIDIKREDVANQGLKDKM